MHKLNLFLVILLFSGVFNSAKLVSQEKYNLSDFTYVSNSKAWLKSNNASGLFALPVESTSYAEIYFNKENGKFINYYQSDNSYDFGLKAESYMRLNPKVVLYGNVSYKKFQGKNMGGSAYLNPYQQAFDIVEFSDSTKGTKELEQYHLDGAISVQITDKWFLGGSFDYKTANYAKRKDLRHKNSVMEMLVSVGTLYKLNQFLEIGGNYLYWRNTEDLIFSMYGNTDRQYWSLVNYGNFMGYKELFGNKAPYTEKDEKRPTINQYNGGSLQFNIIFNKDFKLFNEFTYKSRFGYYGTDSDVTQKYANHDAKIKEYKGILSYQKGTDLHQINFEASHDNLKNYEDSYQFITPESGSSYYKYIGKTQRLDKTTNNISFGYRGDISVENNYPKWTYRLNGEYNNRQQKTTFYPYYRKQTINNYLFNGSVSRNIFSRKAIYNVYLGASYGFGSGTDKKDGITTSAQIEVKEPATLNNYLYREYEYLTASRLGLNLGGKYTRPIADLSTYVALDMSFTKAFDISYLAGTTSSSISIKIGCNF